MFASLSHSHLDHDDADHSTSVIRRATKAYPSGVASISIQRDVKAPPLTLVASSFQVGISFEPPLVLFSAQHSSTSWPLIKKAVRDGGRLGVSVLSGPQGPVARRLAMKGPDRYDGIHTMTLPSGAHLIHGAPLVMECSIYAEHSAGDHDVVLLQVHRAETTDVEPLVWHGAEFRTLAPLERAEGSQ